MSSNNESNVSNAAVGGRPAGSTNWSQQELTDLFTVMEQILPIGSDQWQQLAQIHANRYPNRDAAAIRRKYNILSRKAIPTGDPMCPPEVRWAKKIKKLLADKVALSHCEEKFDLVGGFPDGYVAPAVGVPVKHRLEEDKKLSEGFMINSTTVQKRLIVATVEEVEESGFRVVANGNPWSSPVSSFPVFLGEIRSLLLKDVKDLRVGDVDEFQSHSSAFYETDGEQTPEQASLLLTLGVEKRVPKKFYEKDFTKNSKLARAKTDREKH